MVEVLQHFRTTRRRALVARRLERIYDLARSSGHLARFIVFGSFVTAKAERMTLTSFCSWRIRLTCELFRQTRGSCLITPQLRICLVRASFGFGARPRAAESN